jgi:multiple sugar transport system substrate-binding protein
MRFPNIIACLFVFSLLLTSGAGCFGGGSSSSASEKISLQIWGVFDEDDAWEEIINGYRAIHPNVSVEYTKLRFEEYKDDLIRAIAEGKGPDIFAVHNTWLGEFNTLLEPMPDAITVSHLETQGTLRKEQVLVTTSTSTMSMKTLKQNFIPAVVEDVVWPYQETEKSDPVDKIYALPMGVDTMGLFYNQDMLNAAGIATPPATWSDVQEAVKVLTKMDAKGAITQSGIAMGTGQNVERSSDILSVLMMQNGADMTDDRGRVAFHEIPAGTPRDVNPGLDAVRFYTDFANPTKEVYTWNAQQTSSVEAFANGKAAMFLGYSYHLPILRTLAPKLNIGVAALPQISTSGDVQRVNSASYWAQGVSRDSLHSDYAWDFTLYATNEDHVASYLREAGKPTALRAFIDDQLNDENFGIFAEQLLTAKTWYRGKDIDATEDAMNRLIDDVLAGTYEDPQDAMSTAAKVVSQTY